MDDHFDALLALYGADEAHLHHHALNYGRGTGR